MPKFTYTAMDAKGVEKKGVLDADSQGGAVSQLREMGLFPTNVVESGGGKAAKLGSIIKAKSAGKPSGKKRMDMNINISALWGGTGINAKALTIFTRQLATLSDAGLPLLRGLSVLMRQERNASLKKVLTDLSLSVESGSTFSEALFQHPKVFSKLYINMVKAGEVAGAMELVLNRLAIFMEKAEKIKGKVQSAMFYPIAVLIIAVVILAFLMIKIIPQFEKIFAEMLNGAPLPAFTTFILNLSSSIQHHVFFITGAIVVVIVSIKFYGRTKGGRLMLDRIKMHAPLFGDLVRKASIARFTRTLGTLVASGVPILQALLIVKETSGNQVIADAVGKVHDSVKEGESVVQPLDASGVFPPMVVSMVDVGETTGALPDMLIKVADNYDEEVDNAVAAMVSLLEPIMIVFLAVVVGSIVIALFLPMISIIQNLNQEGSGG